MERGWREVSNGYRNPTTKQLQTGDLAQWIRCWPYKSETRMGGYSSLSSLASILGSWLARLDVEQIQVQPENLPQLKQCREIEGDPCHQLLTFIYKCTCVQSHTCAPRHM